MNWPVCSGCVAIVFAPAVLYLIGNAYLRRWNPRVQDQLRRQRIRDGLCEQCGYDLRGTPKQCPECGQVPEKYSG